MTRIHSAVLFLFAASFAVFTIQATDVFMYLAIVRDFVLKGNWADRDPYLYSLPGAPLIWSHEYLSFILFYLFHSVAGLAGLTLLKVAILAGSFVAVLTSEPKAANRSPVFAAFWILATLAASFRFVERSSLFSDLFTIILARWLLENHRVHWKFLVRLGILFFLWVQIHPGYPAGVALIAIWSLWQAAFNPQFRVRDLAWLALPIGAILLNPEGWEGALYPFKFAFHEARVFRLRNFEWMASYSPTFRFTPEVISFWILCVLACGLIFRERAWLSLRGWLVLAAVLFGATAVRFIPWTAFTIVMAVKPWCEFRSLRTPAWLAPALLALMLVVSAKNLAVGYQSSSGPRHPGFGIDGAFVPQTTVEFLRRNPIPGRVYNTHEFGAYLIWLGYVPIFHHGFVTDMEFYQNDVLGVFASQARFLELAAKYNWTMLLVEKHNSYAYFWRILSPLPDWKIVAEDEGSYLIYKLPDEAHDGKRNP